MQPDLSPPPPEFDPARLIRDHQVGLWRYLRSLGCEHSLAEDLVQETFLVILERPFREQGRAATIGYLRKIAFHRYITYLRKSGKITFVENLEAVASLWNRQVEPDDGEEMLAALRDCFTHLTARAKLALELRFRDELPRDAIATQLEITEHGAKNLMQRAKQQLRECLEAKLK